MIKKSTSFILGVALLAVTACSRQAVAEEMVPLDIKLPATAFAGTPVDQDLGKNVESLSKKPRAPFMAPKGVKNIAPMAKISTDDTNATPDMLSKIVDGDKEAPNMILLRKGLRYVQFDFAAPQELFAIIVWHAHDATKVYHQVVMQLADDAGFTKNVRTLFNNDQENKSGLGVGTDREYVESWQGKLVDAKGAKAQFVRLYSAGSTDTRANEYTEVEIYGRPAK